MHEQNDVLIVDDSEICDALREYLEAHGFTVRSASGARDMDAALAARRPDVVILDVMKPGEDGLSIVRRLAGKTPILMISALGETADRVVGLEIGADDYLAKPFEPREMLARLRALLRRARASADAGPSPIYAFNGWRLHSDDLLLAGPSGEAVALTAGEQALLLAFLEQPRRVLTRDQLLARTRGPHSESFDRAIDLAISRLRRKLQHHGCPDPIETVRGLGNRFASPVRQT